ncbi:MAG: disulfide bond formation protein B [Stellaceae bacterium]
MQRVERGFPVFILVASVVVLGAALLSQYWGGLAPCELCLKERWAWTAAIVVSFVAVTTTGRSALPRVAWLLVAVFAAGSALAFYHVGVEHHWFAGPSACTAPAGAATTVEALKAQILHQQPVRCDEPAWSLWGISLAGWNLIASLIMTAVCLAFLRRLRGSRRSFA